MNKELILSNRCNIFSNTESNGYNHLKTLKIEDRNDHRMNHFHIPFFSVIIATYNRANIIKRALNSLIAQTENDWEAIIVDDGSTDNTYLKVLPYIETHLNIRYLRKSHSGEAMSKNMGIISTTGRFITFLDSDDEFEPQHLQIRKAILSGNPSVKLLHGGVKILGNQFVPDRFDNRKKINLNNCVIGGTFFIERDAMLSLDGFREIYIGTDSDLFERAKKVGIVIKEICQPTYIYHHETGDSLTNKIYMDLML